MTYAPENPLIVQSDRSVLLEVNNPHYEAARDVLARFAELVKSPEFIHTYQITPLSLWNAAAACERADAIIAALQRYAKFDLPANVVSDIGDYMSRYGRLRLVRRDDGALALESDDAALLAQVWHNKQCHAFLDKQIDAHTLLVRQTVCRETHGTACCARPGQAARHHRFPAPVRRGRAAPGAAARSDSCSRRC